MLRTHRVILSRIAVKNQLNDGYATRFTNLDRKNLSYHAFVTKSWRLIGLVGLGSALGALLRTGLDQLFPNQFGWTIILINIIGSGMLAYLFTSVPTESKLRYFLGPGLLGGFTTFSAFSLTMVQQLQTQQYFPAFSYLLATVIGSWIAITLGSRAAK